MSVVDAYLKRIGYAGPLKPNSNLLRDLHRAHLFAIPFENLDIAFGREIICDEDAFLRKIIERHRGGFCYELNGAFAALLRSLGFQVSLLSARVPREDGSLSPEFDHLTLREPSLTIDGNGNTRLLSRLGGWTSSPRCAFTTKLRPNRHSRERSYARWLRRTDESHYRIESSSSLRMAEGKSGWWAQMRSGGARSWTTSTSAWKYKLADCCPPDRPSLRSGQLLAATSTHSSECSGGTCNGPR